MGIVVKQTSKNVIYTYLGFAIGAVNTLFLFTNFLTDDYYGLIGYLISSANIMMPLLAFGVHNSLVKFYSSYKDKKQQDSFVTCMLFLPLALIIPVGFIGTIAYEQIVNFLSKENKIVIDYVWTIYILAGSMAYFEVFYAWCKVNMKSVYGNFLKEVFNRLITMILLFLVFFKVITVHEFILSLVWMYVGRTILMAISAYVIKKPSLRFSLPSNFINVFKYTSLIILAGSIAVVLLDVDKVMIGQFKEIENVAFYNVAVYIAVVIAVPSRAMHQIMYPLTAKLLNENNKKELSVLYKKSSITLYITGGLIFLLILININELYKVLPDEYSGGLTVVLLISIAKLSENLLGNNNAIIFNSVYYRMVLFFGVLLAVLTVILNLLFIPLWGITGAAVATLSSFLIYNISKIYFVWKKFKIHPFTKSTYYTTLIILLLFISFYFWNFGFHPFINIFLKSIMLSAIFIFIIVKFNFSEDISNTIKKFIKI
ncbi:oligosaccharide flippase family protein [Abyssalbus ytuae]|uniref:Oligosaccharide flippase family protein n=1 Tax=Abyssalbus ytuae TaxID=2926907 RepID=A0A9E6ZMG2_9FLAO|nr:oligosaccharide flippase family protein [Abyssalbus ytuae]UOB17374.1 oligosaccharide flippase family protein [Abyssalbus ytuae]